MSEERAALGQWLELSELARRTLASAIDELARISTLQQTMAAELTDHIHGLSGEAGAESTARRRYAMVSALQIEDEVQQRQVHIREMLETIGAAITQVDEQTRGQFGDLTADGGLHRHWQERILERQTLAEFRERVAKTLADPIVRTA